MNGRFLIAFAALILLSSCQTMAPAAASGSPLDGAWELVSATFGGPDRATSTVTPPQIRSLKVLNDGHFSFITVRQDGSVVRSSAGRYSVSGNTYTETIDLSNAPGDVGTTFTFEFQVVGDEWHHRGGKADRRFDEVWRRVR
jgi:hypothetical protein